jgi:hypothetical protein
LDYKYPEIIKKLDSNSEEESFEDILSIYAKIYGAQGLHEWLKQDFQRHQKAYCTTSGYYFKN